MQTMLKEDYSEYTDFLKMKKALTTFKPFCKVLNPNELENIARSMAPVSFEDDHNIMVEGSDSNEMYFVESGT
eukprot:CAMPEP_0194264212 /NCGR_PEP_ID=MMETSP0158-20130606/47467_1 /TAXON_ID=33649 /ORGANISM="Thalassionema nitzschioides, Strain L26-B" /LENGTH=72 /DNA_ID=CAMNT_0039004441 /DNA_START=211 /DNA_END=429 /DNA_ORIENTATION=-